MPRQVDFKVPKIECNGAEEIPYQDMEEVELEQIGPEFYIANCKVF